MWEILRLVLPVPMFLSRWKISVLFSNRSYYQFFYAFVRVCS